jgi:hypothetical protein
LEDIDKDELIGSINAKPMIYGRMAKKIPALVDVVLHLRTEQTTKDGVQRVALSQPDSIWFARDRTGKLARLEPFQLEKPRENNLWKKLGIISSENVNNLTNVPMKGA